MPKSQKGAPFSFPQAAKSLQANASRSGSAAAASYTLIGAIVLLGGLGYGFDAWRGTSPWGVFTGLILGIVVGFYELIKTMWRR
jgi:F0F1-type ATP synthase assembly protein I